MHCTGAGIVARVHFLDHLIRYAFVDISMIKEWLYGEKATYFPGLCSAVPGGVMPARQGAQA
jgi:hypothetical protein